jgi:ribonuclease BN (tRNA processing enzyme)
MAMTPETKRVSRRAILGSLSVAGLAPALAGAAQPPGQSGSTRTGPRRKALTSDAKNRLILLGTSGGPPWWMETDRAGVASAVVVGDRYYLIDAGHGVGRQIKDARLGTWDKDMQGPLDGLQSVFLTHLHSDHIADLYGILGTGLQNGLSRRDRLVEIWGPGNRGALPVSYKGEKMTEVVAPENPTPGTRETIDMMVKTFATDFNDRVIDSGYPAPDKIFAGRDIPLPAQYAKDPNGNPHPRMSPFTFFEDDRVKVSATLVQHAPVFPAYAFKFETDTGTVVFSGDTGPSENLVELAAGADILVHEVIAEQWIAQRHPEPRNAAAEAEYQHLKGAHTTIEEVGVIAEQAGVGTLVLNHMVPGNWPVKEFKRAGDNFSGQLIVGEDLDAIAIGQVARKR